MIKAIIRDYEKKSTSTNANSSCGPAMLSAMPCELLLLLLLPLAWLVQRVKGRILLWDFGG